MISVIIPCYNYGHLIAETIDSVLNQTYTDLEVIVVNDGSQDNTEAVVQEYMRKDKRVILLNYPNAGLGTTRNRGLEKAKGDYIQFLDADDLIEKNKFKVQLELFTSNPDADVVYSSVRYFTQRPFDPSDRKLTYWGPDKEWMPKLSGKGSAILAQTLKGNFSHLSSTLFKKSIVDKVGPFDNNISAVADYHFLLRSVIKDAVFVYHDIPDTYSLVRWHPSNMSKDPNYMWREEIKMRRLIRPLISYDTEATANNENAIKGLSFKVKKTWKSVFLSGGKFDFFKKGLRFIGLERLVRKIFYK